MAVPLQLFDQPHWELKGDWDSVLFFRHIRAVLPSATLLFIEGGSIAGAVADFLNSAGEAGEYLPARQTIWPRSRRYRLAFADMTLATLAGLAERHSEPELMDHLFVYQGSRVVLEFPDAFGASSVAFFSGETDQGRIRDFASALRLEVVSEP